MRGGIPPGQGRAKAGLAPCTACKRHPNQAAQAVNLATPDGAIESASSLLSARVAKRHKGLRPQES